MSKADRQPLPENLLKLLQLVKSGRLHDVQYWIQSGRPILSSTHKREPCPLKMAVTTGFHSIVEVLLNGRGWSQKEIDGALNAAIELHRVDIADLLLVNGANASSIDFEKLCRTVQPEVIEHFLRAGADPTKDNAFARALSETKARPLLRFYRSLKDAFPALHAQACLALTEAVREKSTRWIALLAWAGADPFMPVPGDLHGSWDFGEGEGWTAAHEACWSRSGEIIKVLQLKPTSTQALALVESAACAASVEVLKELFRILPKISLNQGDPPSSKAVEQLIEFPALEHYGYQAEETGCGKAECLQLLLDAGAVWRPASTQISFIRRNLLKQPSRYIVRVLRLLIYTPNAADLETIISLCNSPVLRIKIAECDKHLIKDLDALRADYESNH